MKGRVGIIPMAVIAALLFSTLASAGEYAIPLDRTIDPGRTSIKFDTRIYDFYTEVSLRLRFEKVDDRHVRLFVKPLAIGVQPYCEFSIQWGCFPPVLLTLGSADGNDYLLDTETGYAEK